MLKEQILQSLETIFHAMFTSDIPFARNLTKDAVPQWNSLKHVMFLVQIENQFGFRFDGGLVSEMISIPRIVSEIEKHCA
jgi:acyl carrier protein